MFKAEEQLYSKLSEIEIYRFKKNFKEQRGKSDNLKDFFKRHEDSLPHDILGAAFCFKTSTEGLDYWDKIANKIRK